MNLHPDSDGRGVKHAHLCRTRENTDVHIIEVEKSSGADTIPSMKATSEDSEDAAATTAPVGTAPRSLATSSSGSSNTSNTITANARARVGRTKAEKERHLLNIVESTEITGVCV